MTSSYAPSFGEYQTYAHSLFTKRFSVDSGYAKLFGEGPPSQQLIRALLEDPRAALFEFPGLANVLLDFALANFPVRLQDRSGVANLVCGIRKERPGYSSGVPKQGRDAFAFLLSGHPQKGPALVVETNRDGVPLDDLDLSAIPIRELNAQPASAFAVLNRYGGYVRRIDAPLEQLLRAIGLVGEPPGRRVAGTVRAAIPFGFNIVVFPKRFAATFSAMRICDAFAMLVAAQRALIRILGSCVAGSKPVYLLFSNIKPLCGGTQRRIHLQLWVRTQVESWEIFETCPGSRPDARLLGKRFRLGEENASWSAFGPPVRVGRFDTQLELKRKSGVEFFDLTREELLDLAEMLVYHSAVLDRIGAPAARNIQFCAGGVLIRPFSVAGGGEWFHEYVQNEPPGIFAERYGQANVRLPRARAYRAERQEHSMLSGLMARSPIYSQSI